MEVNRSILSEAAVELLCGLAGTTAMTAMQQLEMRLTGREPSVTPGEAVYWLLGIETRTEAEEQCLAQEAHWA